jgi:hypothetical protein
VLIAAGIRLLGYNRAVRRIGDHGLRGGFHRWPSIQGGARQARCRGDREDRPLLWRLMEELKRVAAESNEPGGQLRALLDLALELHGK